MTGLAMTEFINTPTYASDDITLLLSKSHQAPVSVQEKEALVASGGHYSDVFVNEHKLNTDLLAAYEYALFTNRGAERLAYHIQYLTQELIRRRPDTSTPLILISIVRAGVPLGVLLTRHIRQYFPQIPVKHYGISIIRGRGIDEKALEFIHTEHPNSDHYFVDGWTGKGAISMQLQQSLEKSKWPFEYKLLVDSDPAGTATLSATAEDWLIPFGLIGSQISGLFSRTLWSSDDFHQAALFDQLKSDDIGMDFIDAVEAFTSHHFIPEHYPKDGIMKHEATTTVLIQGPLEIIHKLMIRYKLESIHKVKPGIAEASRAIHRRTPNFIILNSANDPETAYLEQQAHVKGIDVKIGLEGGMGPFKAITILS
jgi:hypothetical protein